MYLSNDKKGWQPLFSNARANSDPELENPPQTLMGIGLRAF
jgi:hypothetical protein